MDPANKANSGRRCTLSPAWTNWRWAPTMCLAAGSLALAQGLVVWGAILCGLVAGFLAGLTSGWLARKVLPL